MAQRCSAKKQQWRVVRTGHGGVDSANIGEERNFRELDGERRRLHHFLFEDLGALAGVVQSIDIEVAEVDERSTGSEVVDKGRMTIGEDVI